MLTKVPGYMMVKHGIQNSKQFTHACDQSYFFSLTHSTKPRIEMAYDWVESGSHQSSHVEYRSYLGSTSPGAPLASHCATIMIKRCYPYQGSYLPPVQVAQLRKLDEEGSRKVGSYTGRTLKKLILFSLDRTFLDSPLQVGINPAKLLLQIINVSFDIFYNWLSSPMQAISLRRDPLDYLSTPSQNSFQFLSLLIGQRAGLWFYGRR